MASTRKAILGMASKTLVAVKPLLTIFIVMNTFDTLITSILARVSFRNTICQQGLTRNTCMA